MTESAFQEIAPGVAMVHSNQMGELKDLFLHWVKNHPLPPFERETILVQSNGIRQWLKLGFAESTVLGVSADTDFLLPSPFIWNTYRAVLPDIGIQAKSILDRGPLTWRIYQLLPRLLETEPDRYEPLSRFLERNPHPIKLYQLATQLADLFDQYQVHRSDWLLDWADETSSNCNRIRWKREEEGSEEIPEDQRWQPALWRALIKELGVEDWTSNSRSTLHAELIQRIDQIAKGDIARPTALPRRIFVFGISSLPQQTLETLGHLGKICQVFFFIQNPCRYYWANIIEGAELLKSERFQPKKRTANGEPLEDLHLFGNPLLAAWGKQGRDFIRLLDDWDNAAQSAQLFKNDHHHFIDELKDAHSLLKKVQWGIFNLDSNPKKTDEHEAYDAIKPRDDSITFHIAHSPQREVEILHDQLLRLFDLKDGKPSDIQPRDVLVMLPDVDRYAPFIDAVFGRREPRDTEESAPLIPYTIADRRHRGHNPIFKALENLLRLPESRFTASEILDLLEVEAIRNKFSLETKDLPTLQRWIRDAGVRWGLDAKHCSENLLFSDPGTSQQWAQNTWEFGLNRLFMGYAMGDGEPVDDISPYAEIGGLESQILGSLQALIKAMKGLRDVLSAKAPPLIWRKRFDAILQDFFEPQSANDERSIAKLKQTLEQWAEESDAERFEGDLPLVVAREAWMAEVDQPSLTQRFLGGNVHFCTLMPMRSIPFKVVCLMGMNAGDYPRQQHPRAFDLMQRKGVYRPGDRSRREDDRYMFLEALLSAKEYLLVSWVGRSIRDNSKQEASVLVNQLRDHLAAGWHFQEAAESDQERAGEALLAKLTHEYPLQPFSERYLSRLPEDQKSVIPLFSYAREWRRNEPNPATPEKALDLPPDFSKLTLNGIVQFLRDPAAHFFNARLNVYFERAESLIEDDENFLIDSLQSHQVKARVLEGRIQSNAHDTIDGILENIRREGQFPMAAAGDLVLEDMRETVLSVLQQEQSVRESWGSPRTEAIDLPQFEINTPKGQTFMIEDWLTNLHPHLSDRERFAIFQRTPSVLQKKGKPARLDKMLTLWVKQLAANATGIKLESYLVGSDTVLHLPCIESHEAAKELLTTLAAGWEEGLTAPLPFAPETSLAYLNGDEKVAKEKYEGRYVRPTEGGPSNTSEVNKSAYRQRAYPHFESLWTSKVGDKGFVDWSKELYGPLVNHFQNKGNDP